MLAKSPLAQIPNDWGVQSPQFTLFTSTGDPLMCSLLGGCCSYLKDVCSDQLPDAYCRIGTVLAVTSVSQLNAYLFYLPPAQDSSDYFPPHLRCYILRALGPQAPALDQSVFNQKLGQSCESLTCQPGLSADHLLGDCHLEDEQLETASPAFLALSPSPDCLHYPEPVESQGTKERLKHLGS